jgi:hypothetical protein
MSPRFRLLQAMDLLLLFLFLLIYTSLFASHYLLPPGSLIFALVVVFPFEDMGYDAMRCGSGNMQHRYWEWDFSIDMGRRASDCVFFQSLVFLYLGGLGTDVWRLQLRVTG